MTSFLDKLVLVPLFLAEVYSTLARIPAPHRASPGQAIKCVEQMAARLRLVGLDGAATLAAIQNAASQKIAASALQSDADRIYSWNTRHFEPFGPSVTLRLSTPPSK